MAAQVVVELAGKEVARTPLKGPSCVIGRDKNADIHLDNRALSRRHAQVEKRGAAIWIRDLGSQNGVFVNGERITAPRPLNGGDVIELGRYKLYIDGVEQAATDTPVLSLTGPEGKHRFAMVGEEIVIGRAPSCDIAIGHKSISRRHLRISQEDGRYFVEDLGSQNGTRINGEKIAGNTEFALGDQIQMSDFTIEVGYLESEKDPSEDRASKTMMIDRSELAKAAYVDGDFERMRASAGRLALGRKEPGTGHSPALDDMGPSAEESAATKGVPDEEPEPPPPPRRRRRSSGPRLQVTHPDHDDRDISLSDEVTLLGEDGDDDGRVNGKSYAPQAYLMFARTPGGTVVSVVGDRQLVTVNGKPQLVATLGEGDTVELGLLTAVFRD